MNDKKKRKANSLDVQAIGNAILNIDDSISMFVEVHDRQPVLDDEGQIQSVTKHRFLTVHMDKHQVWDLKMRLKNPLPSPERERAEDEAMKKRPKCTCGGTWMPVTLKDKGRGKWVVVRACNKCKERDEVEV